MTPTTTKPEALATLTAARGVYLMAKAAAEVVAEAVEEAHPQPDDDAAWEIWNDAIEDAFRASGLYPLERAVQTAKVAVVTAGRECMHHVTGFTAEADVAFAAALGDGRRFSVMAQSRCFSLCMRMDVANW